MYFLLEGMFVPAGFKENAEVVQEDGTTKFKFQAKQHLHQDKNPTNINIKKTINTNMHLIKVDK